MFQKQKSSHLSVHLSINQPVTNSAQITRLLQPDIVSQTCTKFYQAILILI